MMNEFVFVIDVIEYYELIFGLVVGGIAFVVWIFLALGDAHQKKIEKRIENEKGGSDA